MSEHALVERVARAICLQRGLVPDMRPQSQIGVMRHNTGDGLGCVRVETVEGEPHWKGFIGAARAAIDAMRDHADSVFGILETDGDNGTKPDTIQGLEPS